MIKIMNKAFTLAMLFLFLFLASEFLSSAIAEETQKNIDGLSIEEQSKKALETFQKILELTENADRMTVLPQIESAYVDIINKYPKASLSQECYWRLMLIYLTDYNPPVFEKAENLHSEFIKKYPDSHLRNLIDDTLSNSYHRNAKWEKLLRFYTPAVKQFIEKGTLSRPLEMFMYSEAKLNLGDLVEAEKGYKIVIALFPDSKESELSKERLEEVKKRKSRLD